MPSATPSGTPPGTGEGCAPGTLAIVVLGGGALLLIVFLAIGYLLPARWEASASTTLAAQPADVFAYLDAPGGWRRWTPWPDSGLVAEGPRRGPGAAMRWTDPELGSGVFRITETEAPVLVRYRVEVRGGRMVTEGSVRLTPAPDGATVVQWSERSDFGRNPLMGYMARFLPRGQRAEMEKDLARLRTLVESGERPAP